MAVVSCSIDFDSEWHLDGDTCSYNRVFIITYKVPVLFSIFQTLESKEFYYKLGAASDKTVDYIRFSEGDLERTDAVYKYSFSLTPEELAEARDSDGTLKISAWVKAKYKNIDTIYEAKTTLSDLIELPPESSVKNLNIEQYTSVPGKFKCSWSAPSLYKNKPDNEEVNGYCIRLEHLKAGESTYSKVRGLKLDSGKLVKDSNYKEIIYKDISGLTNEQKKSFIENNDITFVGPNCSSTSTEADEVYLEGTSFDFVPKELGIESGDEYIFTIYPYNNIGTYIIDNGNGTGSAAVGTRFTNGGTSYGTKTSKGIVRVKHNNDWKEGQVWVMHNGVWKQAQAVYVRKDGKWQEAK